MIRPEKKEFVGILIYFWWNIWKERYHRTFQHKELQPLEVAYLIKEDIQEHDFAFGNDQSGYKEAVFLVLRPVHSFLFPEFVQSVL